jgi:hypothetical protein
MLRSTRVLAALLAAFALSAAGLVMASAQATTATTITGHVETTANADLGGVIVFAVKGTTVVQYHATDSSGDFSTPSFGHLTGGSWTFVFWDTSDKYATAVQEDVLVTDAAANVLPNQQLELGRGVTGSVTAPSGAQLKSVTVYAVSDAAFDESGSLFNLGVGNSYDDTDTDGTFDIRGLGASHDTLFLAFDEESSFRTKQEVDIVSPGDVLAGTNITNVKVPVAISVHGTASSSKGKASVKLTVSGKKYGIADPHGTFDIYDGTKKLKSGLSLTGGTRTVSLSGLKKGTNTFYFKYHGGQDTVSKNSAKFKVKVK